MSFWKAIFYGLVQGLTEFLPVSSSGHLTLFGRMLGTSESAWVSFSTWLHAGTLISVFIVMRHEIIAILRDILSKRTWLLLVATIPAVIVALLFGSLIDRLFDSGVTLGYEFLITGIMLLLIILLQRPSKEKEIDYRHAAIAGVGQAFAIAPAISRSGATITALLLSGINRENAIRFSFLMSIPAILGGFVLDLYHMARDKQNAIEQFGILNILLGVAAAAVAGTFAMRFMIRRLTMRGFFICAIYVIALGTLILLDQQFTHIIFGAA